jgi:nitroreductase
MNENSLTEFVAFSPFPHHFNSIEKSYDEGGKTQMGVKKTILERRAYRALEAAKVSREVIEDLAGLAGLAPSCYNKQPWRFVFVSDGKILKRIHQSLSRGNEWATQADLVVAVVSKKDLDCVVDGREYFLFDTGMASAFLILRATELGLVAHPIAGFDENQIKEILNIPKDMTLITLIFVARHSRDKENLLTEKQLQSEKIRPPRRPLQEILRKDKY